MSRRKRHVAGYEPYTVALRERGVTHHLESTSYGLKLVPDPAPVQRRRAEEYRFQTPRQPARKANARPR